MRLIPAGRRRREQGLTLLELVIAVAVLSRGTLAALRATDQSRRIIGAAEARLMAATVAENRAEELRLFGTGQGRGLPGTVLQGGRRYAVETVFAPTAAGLVEARITARAESGEGALRIVWLPGPGAGR